MDLSYQYIIYKCLGFVKPPSLHLEVSQEMEDFVQYNVGSLIFKIYYIFFTNPKILNN